MKSFISMAGLATTVSAAYGSAYGAGPSNSSTTVSYSTSYWTECSGSTIGTGLRTGTATPPSLYTQTATDITTQTYCPQCLHTTVYSTAYEVYCPTGVTSQTYMITATASGMSTPVWSTASTDVPPGFTTAVAVCTICGPETITQVMTYPATTVPYVPGMTGAPSAPETPGVPPSTLTPAPVAPAPVCPGPQCQGGYASPSNRPVSSNNTTSIPFEGAATTITLGIFPVIIAFGAVFL